MGGEGYYGFSLEQWERMVEVGLAHLERLASSGGHTDYTEFCREVADQAGTAPQPGDHALAALLRDVGRASYDARGVVVTVLVHYRNQGYAPGPGFFALCQDLGLLPAGSLSEDEKLAFVVSHQRDLESTYTRRRRRRRNSGE